jgi:crossover junction endodeoxyribonuclease RuvC
MPQIIVGIDPSLTGTAICALDSASLSILRICTFYVTDKMFGVARLNFLMKALSKNLNTISAFGKPEIFIEGYAFGARGQSIFNLGELGGIYRLLLAKQWGGYYEVPPMSLKKFITGKGNSNKQVMLEKTFRKYGIGSEILQDDNQVDAFGLAHFGLSFLKFKGGNRDLIQYEKEAVSKTKEKCTL